MLATIITRYITVGIQFFIIVATLKTYGVLERGVVAALIATGGLIGALSSMTIGRGLLTLTEKYKNEEGVLRELYSSAILLLLGLFSFSYIVHAFIYEFFPGFYGEVLPRHLVAFSLAVVYYVWVQVGPYLFSLRGKMRIFNTISLLSNSTILLILFVGYFLNALNFEQFLFGTAFVFFLEFAIGSAWIFLDLGGIEPRRKHFFPILKSGLSLHLDTIGGLLFVSVTVVIVNISLGLKAVAEYDLASRVFALLCIFPQMVQLIMHRHVVFQDKSSLLKKQMKLFRLVSLVYLPFLLISFLVLRSISHYFDFDEGIAFLYATLATAFLPYFYSSMISPYWIKYGKSLGLSILSLTAGSLGILTSVLLIPKIGVYGAAIGVVTSYSIAALVNWRFYRSYLCT